MSKESANQVKARRIAVLGARAVGKKAESCFILYTTRVLLLLFVLEGKSSLVIQFCENHFVDSYYPTIENTFTKTIKYRGNGLYPSFFISTKILTPNFCRIQC